MAALRLARSSLFLARVASHTCPSHSDQDAKDKAAAKARLRRLCEEKGNGKLQVPQWLHDMWRNSDDHLKMAIEYEESGRDKDTSSLYRYRLKDRD